jgi:hypothetical protein
LLRDNLVNLFLPFKKCYVYGLGYVADLQSDWLVRSIVFCLLSSFALGYCVLVPTAVYLNVEPLDRARKMKGNCVRGGW